MAVAEAETSPLRHPICDFCYREHDPKEECPLRSPEEEAARNTRVVAAGRVRYDHDGQ
jgi:hypothetical protein